VTSTTGTPACSAVARTEAGMLPSVWVLTTSTSTEPSPSAVSKAAMSPGAGSVSLLTASR
jgi:hypothetical protein